MSYKPKNTVILPFIYTYVVILPLFFICSCAFEVLLVAFNFGFKNSI